MAPNASPFIYAIPSEKEARVDVKKMCCKENSYSREVLQEMKNHYIKKEDTWSHFFPKKKNYIEEEITWIRTLIQLSLELQLKFRVTANSSIWNVRYTNTSASTFTCIYTIFYEYHL